MKRKLLIFIFSLYLLSSVFCALEEDSRITTSVNTEEHPVFTSIRQHLFPLVKYLYEAATLDNDHGDISKHELVRLVLQNVMHSKILLGHTLLSSSFYKKVFPTVATSYGEHRKNVKNLETQYNYKEISQFHEDFSLLVSRYTMAMSFIELTERAMTDFSVVIVQNEIFCQALTTSVLFLKTFFTSGHQHPNVRISFSFERNRSVVAVKDGYFAFMFEAEFLEYIEIYKAYLAINNILKKFPTLFPFQGLVEPLVVPLEEFPSIPNYEIAHCDWERTLLRDFEKTFFPMNLKCFFREEILLAPHTLNDHIPPSFLEALPDDISPYWCPAKDFKAQLEDAIQLLSPRRNSDAFNQEKEYLVSVCSRNFKFEDDDVNCINTKATYSFNEYIMDFRSMNLLIFNSNAKRDIVLVSEKYIQCCVTSHLEGFHALYESFFKTIAFEKEVGLPYFKIGPMLSENFRRHVALLDLVDIYSLERLWNRLYILVCVAPNITPGQTASPGVIFEPIVKDIVFECYKVYFFTFLEDLLTVLCKSIFEEYCETSDPSACSEFIKHRVSRYMTIFRDPANLQSKYSTNVSCELTELVGRLDDLIVHNTLQRAEHICSTLYSHPFIQVKLPINLLPEIVYNFRDVLVKDIKDLDVSEESPVGIHLNLINDGLLAFGTNVPQSDRPTMPSNSRAVMRQFLKGERKKQNAANKEASRRNSSLISTSKDTKKSKHPPRKLKAVNREVSNIIQKALPIDAPDSHDKQVIGNYDSILSYIDQILDLPSSNLPPSLDHLKRKEQATAFIQDMNKYFELL